MIELYHSYRSTCSRRVRICLMEKRIPFTLHTLNLQKFEHHTPEYLRLNPNGYVPTLVHDGVPLIESTVINEYLDQCFPAVALRPANPRAQARMRVWTKFIDDYALPAVVVPTWSQALAGSVKDLVDDKLQEALSRIPLQERRDRWKKIAREGYSTQEFEDAHAKLVLMFERMEAALQADPWLAGETFSLADVNITPYVVRAGEIDPGLHDVSRYPRAMGWLDRIKQRPWFDDIFVAAIPGPDAAPVVAVA